MRNFRHNLFVILVGFAVFALIATRVVKLFCFVVRERTVSVLTVAIAYLLAHDVIVGVKVWSSVIVFAMVINTESSLVAV